MASSSAGSQRSFRRLAPNVLTAARPILGALCGAAVYHEHAVVAAWLYLAGFLTDVGDGFLARALRVESGWGRRLDGWADVAFHALVGAGLAAHAARDNNSVVLAALGLLLAGSVAIRLWFDSYSVFGKAMAIPYRIVMFGLILGTAPHRYPVKTLLGGLGILAAAFTYEGVVTWREFRRGSRALRRRQ